MNRCPWCGSKAKVRTTISKIPMLMVITGNGDFSDAWKHVEM